MSRRVWPSLESTVPSAFARARTLLTVSVPVRSAPEGVSLYVPMSEAMVTVWAVAGASQTGPAVVARWSAAAEATLPAPEAAAEARQ